MKRRILSFTLCLMLLTLIPSGVFAAETANGKEGADITWSLDKNGSDDFILSREFWNGAWNRMFVEVTKDGTMTLTGEGEYNGMNWLNEDDIIFVKDKVTKLVVGEGIVCLDNNMFEDFVNLGEVTLPSTLTYMDNELFRNCDSLESIVIPENVERMELSVFTLCDNLRKVTFMGNKLTSIEAGTFEGCVSLAGIEIPSGVTKIGSDAFRGCTALETVTIPATVTQIATRGAFGECENIKTVYYEGTEEEWNKIDNYTDRKILSRNVIYNSCVSHKWDETILNQADCTHAAEYTAVCEVCGASKGEYTKGEALGHDIQYELVTEATCSEVAYYREACTRCEFKGESFPNGAPKGHNEVTVNSIEATYESEGYTGDVICSVCGEMIKKGEVIPVLKKFVYGDVNNDGKINALDATQILRFANNKSSVLATLETARLAADVNGDNKINALDATQILRYANNKSSALKK